MSASLSGEGSLRPVVRCLAAWLAGTIVVLMIWASTAGAQEVYRGSAVVADVGSVAVGDPVGLSVVVFDDLAGEGATVTVFSDRGCSRKVTELRAVIDGPETVAGAVTFDGPGTYFAQSMVDGGPVSTCAQLVEAVAPADLSLTSGGDRVRVESSVLGIVTAVLMGPDCTGGSLGAVQWTADSAQSVSPVLRAPRGLRAESVEVTVSGNDGRSITKCGRWESAAEVSAVPTTSMPPTVAGGLSTSARELVLTSPPATLGPAAKVASTTTSSAAPVTTAAGAAKATSTATLPTTTAAVPAPAKAESSSDTLAETGVGRDLLLAGMVLTATGMACLLFVLRIRRLRPGVEMG